MDTPSELNEVVLPQNVIGPLTRSAIFLVLCIRQEEDAYARLRAFCAGLSGLVRAVEFRDVSIGYLSHNDSAVQLYLQETFVFRVLTTEAGVALSPSQKSS